MARLKKVYTDPEYTRDKKRERIRAVVSYIFAACMIIGIGICGVNQTNDRVVGVGCLALGILSVGYVGFKIYTYVMNWKILTIYDQPDYWRIRLADAEEYQKEKKRVQALAIFGDIGIAGIGLFLLIFGILRLTGVA